MFPLNVSLNKYFSITLQIESELQKFFIEHSAIWQDYPFGKDITVSSIPTD